ncbi:MAG: NuoM family protein [Nitrososphaerales archaeon]
MAIPILSLMIFIPFVAAPFSYIIGRYSERGVRVFAFLVSIAVFSLAVFSYASILFNGTGGEMSFREGPWQWIPTFQGVEYHLGLDGLGAPLVLISAFLTVLVVLGSWDLIKTRQALYYALILFFEGSMIGVFTSLNLILFYVFWELVLIPMFFFIGIWGGPRRKYAAMKFLLFTYVGSLVMLLGFLALYIFAAPTFDMQALTLVNIPFWLQTLASIATFVGFGVKLPVVPFHTWLPDAHVEAPAPISVFLAGLLLKMGGYGFIRVNLSLFPDASLTYGWVFMAIGLITMFYGAIVAMMQKDLKRMIALTSINHMGFVLLGAYTLNLYGVSGAVFQMFNHASAIGLLFMLSGYIHEQAGTREIPLLKGLKNSMPTTAVLLMLGSMAGMGIPMFASFLSEYMVIVGAISFDVRLAAAVLVPVITAAYFLWMIRKTVMTPMEKRGGVHDMSSFSALHLSIYLVPLLLLLIFPWLVLNLTNLFAENLIQLAG